jgi:hypothetical protein
MARIHVSSYKNIIQGGFAGEIVDVVNYPVGWFEIPVNGLGFDIIWQDSLTAPYEQRVTCTMHIEMNITSLSQSNDVYTVSGNYKVVHYTRQGTGANFNVDLRVFNEYSGQNLYEWSGNANTNLDIGVDGTVVNWTTTIPFNQDAVVARIHLYNAASWASDEIAFGLLINGATGFDYRPGARGWGGNEYSLNRDDGICERGYNGTSYEMRTFADGEGDPPTRGFNGHEYNQERL